MSKPSLDSPDVLPSNDALATDRSQLYERFSARRAEWMLASTPFIAFVELLVGWACIVGNFTKISIEGQ